MVSKKPWLSWNYVDQPVLNSDRPVSASGVLGFKVYTIMPDFYGHFYNPSVIVCIHTKNCSNICMYVIHYLPGKYTNGFFPASF